LEPRLDDLNARLAQVESRQQDDDLASLMPAHRRRQRERYLSLALLQRRGYDTRDLSMYELSVFSQNGEDGVLLELLHRVGTGPRYFVEFGAGEGLECCCAVLADVLGWEGLFAEADDARFGFLSGKYGNNERVTTIRDLITAENVEEVFDAAGVPADFDVLSIDVDGADYWTWRAIERYRPRIVIIEYNSGLDAREPLVQGPEPVEWQSSDYFGASLAALTELARAKGYSLAHLEQAGVNAFFVRDDLSWDDPAPPTHRAANYLLAGYRHVPDPEGRSYIRPDAPGDEGAGRDA